MRPDAPMSYDPIGADEAGIDPRRLALFLERVRLDVEDGPLPSAQVAVARGGRLVAFESYGASNREKRYILQSVGRLALAAAVWKLIGDGLLQLAERVSDVIPEFGTNGKDLVTLEHLLTHTAGFPYAPIRYPDVLDRPGRLRAFARWRLDWEPGSRFQFHLTGAAWVIAELVERKTGLSFAEYLRTTIVKPLGLGLMLPVPAELFTELVTAPEAIDRVSENETVDPNGPWYLADPDHLAVGEPSHSIAGSAADVALLLQAIYHSDLWRPDVVADATRIRFSARERIYGGGEEIVNMALFCTVSGEVGGSLTPRTGSPMTFGHAGAPCQLGFIDPTTDISFAFLTNGYPLTGNDSSIAGRNRIINLANLGNDLVA